MSDGEELLIAHIRILGLPAPEREYKFHPKRRWRFDLAFVDRKIAVEVEGGVYQNGRHTRGKGFEADLVKYNEAARLGWAVYRFSTGQVSSGEAAAYLERVFEEMEG